MARLGLGSNAVRKPSLAADTSFDGPPQILRKCSPHAALIQGKFCRHLELANLSDMIADG